MPRLWQTLIDLRNSLWFIPASVVLVSIGLAAGAIALDTLHFLNLADYSPALFGASPEGARGLLETIAGAAISTATLSFSITVLVLSNAALQYTPAVIRTFMNSRPTQLVLGSFIGIFVYCLIVLRTVRGGQEEFVPAIAVVLALLLAIVGVGLLVYFVHHVAMSIQAPAIISRISSDTLGALERQFPELEPGTEERCEQPPAEICRQHRVPAQATGYLRFVDIEGVRGWAQDNSVKLEFAAGVGGFVCCGEPLLWLDRDPGQEARERLERFYGLGQVRTIEQDPALGLEQLVDIAIKAMSPSTRDLGTVQLCLDYMAAVLVALSRRRLQRDASGQVLLPSLSFGMLLSGAIQRLLDQAGADVFMYIRMTEMLERTARQSAPAARENIAEEIRKTLTAASHRLPSFEMQRLQLLAIESLARIKLEEQHASDKNAADAS